MITLDRIHFGNKNFSIACGLREKFRSEDYTYEATYNLIDWIFNNLDMHRLQLSHNIDNEASQRIIEKLGATYEGIARHSKFYDGKFKDRKIYSILKPEWENRKN